MQIGTVRVEEARVFNDYEGYHKFKDDDGNEFGSFEVFFVDKVTEEDQVAPGWYWVAGFPGCLWDGEPDGPFASSSRAYFSALED